VDIRSPYAGSTISMTLYGRFIFIYLWHNAISLTGLVFGPVLALVDFTYVSCSAYQVQWK
jgi:hypothetical protein